MLMVLQQDLFQTAVKDNIHPWQDQARGGASIDTVERWSAVERARVRCRMDTPRVSQPNHAAETTEEMAPNLTWSKSSITVSSLRPSQTPPHNYLLHHQTAKRTSASCRTRQTNRPHQNLNSRSHVRLIRRIKSFGHFKVQAHIIPLRPRKTTIRFAKDLLILPTSITARRQPRHSEIHQIQRWHNRRLRLLYSMLKRRRTAKLRHSNHEEGIPARSSHWLPGKDDLRRNSIIIRASRRKIRCGSASSASTRIFGATRLVL